MKPSHGSRLSPSGSAFYWVGIYALVVALPVLTVWHFVGKVVQERLESLRGGIAQTLEQEARLGAKAIGPWLLERLFRDHMKKSPEGRRRFLEGWERAFPGATRILLWKAAGVYLPVPASQRFPDVEKLEEALRTYLLRNLGAQLVFDQQSQRSRFHPSLEVLQAFLGSEVFVETLLRGFGHAMEVDIQGIPSLLFWDSPFGIYARIPPDAVHGFLLWIDTQRLPGDILARLAVSGGMEEAVPGRRQLVLLNLAHPERSRFGPDLPKSRRLAIALRQAYLQRSAGTFPSGDWLVTTVPKPVSANQVLLRLRDVSELKAEEKATAGELRRMALVALVIGGLGTLVFGWGFGGNFGLRWRVLVLLSLATLLPLSAVFWVGTAYLKERDLQEKTSAYKRMRMLSQALVRRFELFPTWLAKTLLNRLDRDLPRCRDEAALVAYLEGKRQISTVKVVPGLISHYSLGDARGNVSHTSMMGEKSERIGIKILLQRLHRQTYGTGGSGSLFGESLVEDLEAKDGGATGHSRFHLPLRVISRIKLGKGTSFFLPLAVTVGGQPRMLLIRFSLNLMEQHFMRFELARGVLAADRRMAGAVVNVFFPRPVFSVVPFPATELDESWVGNVPDASYQEALGEFTWKDRVFLYFLTPRSDFDGFRVIFTMDRAYLQALALTRQRRLWLGMGGFLFFTLLIGMKLTRHLLEPIHLLHRSLERIGAGDLAISLPACGHDEIARLERNVNQMTRELREKDRLQAYLPQGALQAIRDGTSEVGEEAREQEVTILISDIRGFTTLSETYPPEAIFTTLNDYFDVVEGRIRAHQGQVQKFIGDAVYAVFPASGSEGARQAVAAATEMVRFLQGFNQDRQARGLFPIAIGIGIHTGRVLLGKVGSAERQEFAYIGEAVTLASTLESASKQGRHTRIMLSEATVRLLGPGIRTEPLQVKLTEDQPEQKVYELIDSPTSLNHPSA